MIGRFLQALDPRRRKFCSRCGKPMVLSRMPFQHHGPSYDVLWWQCVSDQRNHDSYNVGRAPAPFDPLTGQQR